MLVCYFCGYEKLTVEVISDFHGLKYKRGYCASHDTQEKRDAEKGNSDVWEV